MSKSPSSTSPNITARTWRSGWKVQTRKSLPIWRSGINPRTPPKYGTKWLPDLRQWWRKSGRTLDVPVDGVTGPTRPAGAHALSFTDTKGALKSLPAGQYTLVVEAAREVGGRELVKVPFTWPATSSQTAKASGSSELGAVSLVAKP